jgi:hypothetical protein
VVSRNDNSRDRVTRTWADSATQASYTVIQTINSTYLFLTTFPAEQRGLLIGPAVPGGAATALLVGALVKVDGALEYLSCPVAGSHVVFVVEANGQDKRVITSRVRQIVHARTRSDVSGEAVGSRTSA